MRASFLVCLLFAALAGACSASLGAMHAAAHEGAVPIGTALRTRRSVEIRAPAEVIWRTLAHVEGWPVWHPQIEAARAETDAAADATFVWQKSGVEITSRFALVRPNEMLSWSGSAWPAIAAHVWRLEWVEPDRTRVHVEEAMDGPLLELFFTQADLDADVEGWLVALEIAAEARSAPP